jgi:hypothetical protein
VGDQTVSVSSTPTLPIKGEGIIEENFKYF